MLQGAGLGKDNCVQLMGVGCQREAVGNVDHCTVHFDQTLFPELDHGATRSFAGDGDALTDFSMREWDADAGFALD